MKLRVKCAGKAFPFEIGDSATVKDLKEAIRSLLNVEHFSLSLNNRDYFDGEANLLTSLKDQGIVNGDTIYVALREGTSVTITSPTSGHSADAQKPVAKTSEASTSNQTAGTSKIAVEKKPQKSQDKPKTFEKLLEETKPVSAAEAVIICIHSLLIDRGFQATRAEDVQKRGLPSNWRQGLAFNVAQLDYRHPNSDVPLHISVVVQGQSERTFVDITGHCVLGDSTENRRLELRFGDYFVAVQSAEFKTPDGAAMMSQRLQTELIDQLQSLVVGYPDTPLLNLPYDVKVQLIRRLPIIKFRILAESCKEMKKLWDDDSLWKRLLLRDFGKDAVSQAERNVGASKYRDLYRRRYTERKEAQQRRILVEPRWPNPNPPPGVTDPYAGLPPTYGGIPGMIGGPHDLYPAGGFPAPGGGWHPGGDPMYLPPPGGPRPFGPRIRPVFPYDPDAGLFGPRQPGPRPRNPNPRGGGNPFGGGPHFPGGRFI